MEDIMLQVMDVSKSFGPTKALSNVGLDLKRGCVYSLIGKNGAGKTTLVNIIAGVYKADSGKIVFEGEDITGKSLAQRQKSGIRIVTQHASVIPYMSVAENISVGFWPRSKSGLVDWKRLKTQAEQVLKEYGINIDPETTMFKLDTVSHRKINIIRALFGGGRLIILDEPTTSLSSTDRETLFEFIRHLAAQGITFIFISHYLDEVMKLSGSEYITVIRDGCLVPVDVDRQMDAMYLANLLAGENIVLTQRTKPSPDLAHDEVLSCAGLCAKNLDNVFLTVKKGEIIGLVGFPNSGAQELCRTLYGLTKIESGQIRLAGKDVKAKNPTNMLRHNIVYIPHDRHHEGIIQGHTIERNICLPVLKSLRSRVGLIEKARERELAQKMKDDLGIKSNSIYDSLSSLSGGNQQKVVVAKALVSDPYCLILDEPTIGIDVKSREEILSLVNERTKAGMCALYYTNDFDEMARICDKIAFFQDGRLIELRDNTGLRASDIINIRDRKKREVTSV